MGFHRYVMVWLYFKHKDQQGPAPPPARGAAPRHRPAPDLQRDVRGRPAARVGRRDPLPEGPARDPGPRRLDRRDDRDREPRRRALPRARLRHPLPAPHRPHRLQGGRARRRPADRDRASSSSSSTPTSWRPPDILEKTLGHFADPKVGMVQARWGHINRDYSLLTEVQSIMLDGHFIMEHGARSRAGRFFNFNGTAGVWRRAVIADAGGWQHDTLTEDLDLSYRAQMRGWRFVYLPDLVCPRRAAGRDERLQDAAAALGQGLGAGLQEAAAAGPRLGPPLAREGGGHLPPHREPRLPADGAARRPHVPGDDHALQHGLRRDDRGGRADLPRRDRVRLRLLRALAEGAVPGHLEDRSSSTSRRCSASGSASASTTRSR